MDSYLTSGQCPWGSSDGYMKVKPSPASLPRMKGIAMAKKKIRKHRWEHREVLKENANKHKQIKAMHPQVRRQLQKDKY